MNLIKFIVVSLALATLATVISLIIGKLMVPGVYYTIEGGFIGVELKPEVRRYIFQVFVSFFVCSFLACLISNLWVRKNSKN